MTVYLFTRAVQALQFIRVSLVTLYLQCVIVYPFESIVWKYAIPQCSIFGQNMSIFAFVCKKGET